MTAPAPSLPPHPPAPSSSPPPRTPESLPKEEGSTLLSYALAVTAVVVALLAQRLLWPYMASGPFLAFF
ncbi:hypothetical protein D7X55_20465, partial [Corallococcus sp. AB049A]